MNSMDLMRPTTSKVRLAIISMLSEKLIADSKILDIFAGIGTVSEEFIKFMPKPKNEMSGEKTAIFENTARPTKH